MNERLHDKDAILDCDCLGRQANTVVRLAVVSIFGLTERSPNRLACMNLSGAAEDSRAANVLITAVVLAATKFLNLYTVVESKRSSGVFDAVSDDRLSKRGKLQTL